MDPLGSGTPRDEPRGLRLFDSSRTLVTGGQFTQASRDHAGTIVHNHYYGHEPGIENRLQLQPPSTDPTISNSNTIENQESQVMMPPAPIPFQDAVELRIQRTNQIYERHMLSKGRGYPLWIPECSMGLSVGKRRLGISVGDVGLVTSAGGFSFLFNILLPVDHPFHPRRMPAGFTPMEMVDPSDIMTVEDLSSNSCLTSMSVRRVDGEQTGTSSLVPEQVFELSESEGVVLALPDGAISSDMENLRPWKNYMAKHIASWYLYVNGQLGREVQNGDIRLVVGVDKTSSWGMAVAEQNRQSPNSQRRRLRFGLSPDANSPVRHKWDCTGFVEARAGPRLDVLQQLLSDPADHGADIDVSTVQNQCVFIRTLNATLSGEMWGNVTAEVDSIMDDPKEQCSYSNDSAHPSKGETSTMTGRTTADSQPIASWTGSKNYANNWVQDPHNLLRRYVDGHPGNTLNEALLTMTTGLSANARMAITSDHDWCRPLRSSMNGFYLNETFWKYLVEQSAECAEEGILQFKELPILPTLENAYIQTINHAHQLFFAVVQGRLPLVQRRLNLEEMRNIKSGDIYVWEDKIMTPNEFLQVPRWVDAKTWGPSRVQDGFLVYQQRLSANQGLPYSSNKDISTKIEPLVKKTYSAYTTLFTTGTRIKLNMIAYFTPSKMQGLTINNIPGMGDTIIEDGLFQSARVTRRNQNINSLCPQQIAVGQHESDALYDGAADSEVGEAADRRMVMPTSYKDNRTSPLWRRDPEIKMPQYITWSNFCEPIQSTKSTSKLPATGQHFSDESQQSNKA
ncbi:hypothetical protein CVT24_003445 [Panaeolus cyanescens]|uniref:Uncharacterized protein n=1 Tax=Panaeolus cyanescens TaxID=181874 RepID=A0A409Y725_9AGAR|nr:hypothetical protein CVT24_003445 [Panaeolus cyanescens]